MNINDLPNLCDKALQVVIAGGGMVGASLAHGLRQRLGADCRLLLVEESPLPPRQPDIDRTYSPSFDARSTALSYGSCLIYRELELWNRLRERACPIETVHVSAKGRFGSARMCAADQGWPALGYVIENAWLGNVLIQALHGTGVATRSPDKVVSAGAVGNKYVQVTLESGATLETELLVVADGSRSELRDALGIGSSERHYGQCALIANIAHSKPHGGTACERFTRRGPIAMLPLLAADDGSHRSALVWSLPEDEAATLLAAEEGNFLAHLQKRFGYRLGRLLRAGERHSYPLSLVEADEQVRQGVVVMGNAAHSLHPVAGQGFNLALRDVARLGDILGRAWGEGRALGDLQVLEQYRTQQAADQRMTTRFSDRLPGLFMRGTPVPGPLRDLGLAALDISPGLKREFVRYTAGMAASADYRNVQP